MYPTDIKKNTRNRESRVLPVFCAAFFLLMFLISIAIVQHLLKTNAWCRFCYTGRARRRL